MLAAAPPPGMTEQQGLLWAASASVAPGVKIEDVTPAEGSEQGKQNQKPQTRKKNGNKDNDDSRQEPATPLQKALKLQAKLLKYCGGAKKFTVGLAGIEMSDGMASWMSKAGGTFERLYESVRAKTASKLSSASEYEDLTQEANRTFEIYEGYLPLANQMLQGKKPKGTKKKKAEAAATGHPCTRACVCVCVYIYII